MQFIGRSLIVVSIAWCAYIIQIYNGMLFATREDLMQSLLIPILLFIIGIFVNHIGSEIEANENPQKTEKKTLKSSKETASTKAYLNFDIKQKSQTFSEFQEENKGVISFLLIFVFGNFGLFYISKKWGSIVTGITILILLYFYSRNSSDPFFQFSFLFFEIIHPLVIIDMIIKGGVLEAIKELPLVSLYFLPSISSFLIAFYILKLKK